MEPAILELLGPLGASGLVALAVVLLYTGKLVTRRELDEAIRDRDYWRDVALKLTAQNAQLMTGAEVAADVLRALPDVTPGERPGRPR